MDECLSSALSRLSSPVCDAVQEQALKLVQLWISAEQDMFKDNIPTWTVCALYIASVHVKYGKGLPVSSGHDIPEASSFPTLSQLLQSTNTNIKSFFEHMSKVGELMGFNDTVKQNLMTLKQKYLITYAIFCKFEKLYSQLFKSPDEVPCSTDGSCDITCDKRKTCWLLFLLAKGSMLSECGELVLPLQLMLSCVDYLLRKALPFTVREAYSQARFDLETSAASGDGPMDACLAVVCKEGGMGECVEEVAMVRRSFFLPFIEAIGEENMNCDVEAFPKLAYLESRYHEMYLASGDINELYLLNFDPTLTPDRGQQVVAPMSPDSTVKSPIFLTPVRRAITTVQTLKNLLSDASNMPSDVLHRYFTSCQVNPEIAIAERVERLNELFVGHYVGEVGVQASEVACTRFRLGLRLYYRIMEAMLVKEEKRLSTSDFSTLLGNDAFHRSLLACALEVVMVTFGYTASPINHGMSALGSKLLFPWILDVFDLQSYNFLKVIESFIKNEAKLTEEARKHLQDIETQIVECLAWSVTSPLFDALRAVKGIEVNDYVTQSPQHTNSSHTTAADMFLSPVRPGHYSRTRQNEATPPRHSYGNGSPHLSYSSPKMSPRPSPHPSPKASPRPSPDPSPNRGLQTPPMRSPNPSPSRSVAVTQPECSSPGQSHTEAIRAVSAATAVSADLAGGSGSVSGAGGDSVIGAGAGIGLVKGVVPTVGSGASVGPGSGCPVERPGSKTLNTFFNKVLQLAYNRLHTMCNLLKISKELNARMWTCVSHSITNKPWLLRGRHLDQIIMCCIYGICKVRELELKFKDIVSMYRGLPNATSQTYRNVYMGANKEGVSIIAFYNDVFIPNMREFIHKFQFNVPPSNLSPVPSRCQAATTQAAPVYQVPGANLYISPMKDSPFKSPHPVTCASSPGQMTPRTRNLYSFGETLGSERLRQFNEQVAGMPSKRNQGSVSKRLRLEELAGPEEKEGSSAQDNDTDEADVGVMRRPSAGQLTSMQRRVNQYASDSQSAGPKTKRPREDDKKN